MEKPSSEITPRLHEKSLAALREIHDLVKNDKRIVFVSGNFNIVHPGHLRLLQFAAENGDYLVAGVLDDSSSGAALPEDLRLDGVRSIGFVNYAFILKDKPEDFIAALKPHFVVKGKEYEERVNDEKSVVESYGGQLIFGSGEVRFSSLELLKKEFLETPGSNISHPYDFLKRHSFNFSHLEKTLSKFSGMRVVVLGDLIVDDYITCDPLGMSQEDPTIVVTPVHTDRFIGGAGIVAAHAQGMGAEVEFFSVVGHDETARYAHEKLASYGVVANLIEDASRPTTLKQRYRARGKTLLRVSQLRQHDIGQDLSKTFLNTFRDKIQKADLVVFSDFNYGCLPQKLVEKVLSYCAEKNIPMVADSQSSSQTGDVSRFKGMMLITPTEREARLAVRDSQTGLVMVADLLRKKARAKNVVVTLGSEGVLIRSDSDNSHDLHTDQLPAFNTAPKDVSGAGDSLLITSSMALAAGNSIWESVYLGSLAAACQVGRVGNTPLTAEDLLCEMRPGMAGLQ